MAKATGALEYLGSTPGGELPPVCVIFGGESFLKRQSLARVRKDVLGGDEGDLSLAVFDGEGAELRDVLAELSTIAMFGGKRLVVVEEADDFISRCRAELEAYCARPLSSGMLVLVADTFPSNTRLYKSVAASGLAIDCGAPTGARLTKWLVDWAAAEHRLRLSAAGAERLLDIAGSDLGLLDQELAKLALIAGENGKVGPEEVGRTAGNWRTRTTWEMLDAALAGDVGGSLGQLTGLLGSGETPVGLLAMISASLRRLAAATRLILQAEAQGKRIALRTALEEAGIKPFVLQKTEQVLRRLGRRRGAELYRRLLEADLDLKGDSALPPRLVLERLLVRLAAPEGVGEGVRG